MDETVVSLAATAVGESMDSRSMPDAPPSVLEILSVATYACDAGGRILWFNRKAAELWGRAPRVGDDSERFCGSYRWYFNGRRIAREATPMAYVLKTGAAVHGAEGVIERPDGSRTSVMLHIEPVKDRAGDVIGAVNCFYDTAHRERTGELARSQAAAAAGRQMLQEQSRRFATTYEHATVAIAEVDAGGRRIGVNEAACAITGRSRAELIGGNIFHVLHAEDRDDDFDQYQRLVAGEIDRYSIEKRIVRKDGRVIWVAVTSSSVRDAAGKFVYGVRIFEDITERKAAEDKLRERERQFRELLEGLPAAVYATDALGRVTFYNHAVVELAGRRPELGGGEWPAAWPLFRPDGAPLPYDQSPMAVALKENKPVRGAEAVAERPDGTRAPFIPYATPLHDASGALIGAVNVLVDISERKQAETAQRVLLDELNHRVKNNMQMLHSLLRAAQRETGNAEAQAVLADASRRIAAMAAAQQVLYDADHPTNYNTGDFLAAVCGSARQSLGKTIDIVCEILRQRVAERNRDAVGADSQRIDHQRGEAWRDDGELRDQGRVGEEPRRLRAVGRGRRRRLRSGGRPQALVRTWPGERSRPATGWNLQGRADAGCALRGALPRAASAQVRLLPEDRSMAMSNLPSQSASLLKQSGPVFLPDERSSEHKASAAPRILIVEDDYLVAMEAEAALVEAGFEAAGIASSAEEAVALAKTERPTLAVMDIRLIGRRDGVDAALDIFRETGVRCVFATAHHTLETRARAAPTDPLGWLPKPYSMDDLVEAIRFALAELSGQD